MPQEDEVAEPGETVTPRALARREAILRAAQEIAGEQGLTAATVRTVAARAGLGASTMRYYFPSQQALNSALAERMIVGELGEASVRDGSLPPTDRLLSGLLQLLPGEDGSGARHQLQGWLTMLHTGLVTQRDGLPHATLAALTRGGRRAVEQWLRVLADEGHLDGSEVAPAAAALLTRVDGLCLALLNDATGLDLAGARRILRTDVEHLLGG